MFATLRAVSAWSALAAAFALSANAIAEPVATVNGVDIESVVFDNYLASRLQKPAEQATPDEREAVLSELKDIYLLSSQPRAKALADTPDVEAQMEIQRRGILAQAVVSDFLESNPATEEEIFDEYTAQMALAPKSQFKARHILVETQGEASELITQLDGGADFAELARENSTGPTGPNGGDLGWFAPEQMVPAFSTAVQALEDGAYTKEPVQTQFGWHVILREDTRATEPPPLDSLRDRIKQRVESQKFQTFLNELRGDEVAD
jgi:peptidyl-prolyl cis-trans isomerase C